MNGNGMDEKDIMVMSHPRTTAINESLKRPWQTPDIIEEDFRETETSYNGSGFDFGLYS
jgi:hypothetical protein